MDSTWLGRCSTSSSPPPSTLTLPAFDRHPHRLRTRERHTPEAGGVAVDSAAEDAAFATANEVTSALDTLWDEISSPEAAAAAAQPPDVTFEELLFGAWNGIDMRAAADDCAVQPSGAAPAFVPVAGGEAPFTVDDVLNSL